MSSTLKLDSFRTRGGSFSLVGMDVISNKPKRTIIRGRTSCVTIAFLSRLEFKNLFMNIALYWCHFNFMPVSSPNDTNIQINQNIIIWSYCLSICLSIRLSVCFSVCPSVSTVCRSVCPSVSPSIHRYFHSSVGLAVNLSFCPSVCPHLLVLNHT